MQWRSRAHFFAVAAQLMRRILVDEARRDGSVKRGARRLATSLDDALVFDPGRSDDLLALDEALARLESLDARKSRIVELRFFGGLSVKEVAAVLDVSNRTVLREWQAAKAWLYGELSPAPNCEPSVEDPRPEST